MASFRGLSAEQIETLSEIVFGLSITFSAIQFAFNPPRHLTDILLLIIEFALSFSLLIWVWITWIRIVGNLGRGTTPSLFLTIVLLLLATIEPYLLYTIWIGAFTQASPSLAEQLLYQGAAAAWAIDAGLILVVLGVAAASLRPRGEEEGRTELPGVVRSYSRWLAACGVALWITALPLVWVLVYSARIGNADIGMAYPSLYLSMILWVPIFVAVGYGSYRLGQRLDRALEAVPAPTHSALGPDIPKPGR